MSNVSFTCFICKIAVKASDLKWHLKQLHNIHNNNRSLVCYQDSCMRTFDRFSSYKKHLHQCHENKVGELHYMPELSFDQHEHGNASYFTDESEKSDDETPQPQVKNDYRYDLTEQCASFIARLRATNSMTMQNVGVIVECATELVSGVVSHLEHYVS